MDSASEDLTARANIRNAALRLFADHGADAVTVRDIATATGVSPALVIHHFGSKDGLRAEVDRHAAQSFDSLFAELDDEAVEQMMAQGAGSASIAEAFGRVFPPTSPLPSYLRRLLLSNDPAGAALFGRWFEATRQLLETMVERGAALPSPDLAVRAAFLLVNDLALILLRNQIAAALGVDPLTPQGLDRWAREVTPVYAVGIFGTDRT